MRALPLLLLALIPLPAGRAATAPQNGRDSLERMLERQREARARELAQLAGDARAYLDAFAQLHPPIAPEREAELVSRLTDLGPAVGTLLVPYLDPGVEGGEVLRVRARAVADALTRISDVSLTDPLLALVTAGGEDTRRNALRALEACVEPDRARPVLLALFESDPGPLRASVLASLVRMGGSGNEQIFARVLSDDDVALRALGLGALIGAASPDAEAQVRALLDRPAQAVSHIPLLLEYYRTLPAQVDDEVLGLWVRLVTRTPKSEDRLRILAALPDLGAGSASALRRQLEPLTSSGDPAVVEGARIALARLGDRNARRDLLRSYDEFVDKNNRWSQAYTRRAEVLMRLHDWDEAIKDYNTALRFGRDDGQRLDEAYLGLARACARRGKLKDAAEWLRKAPISMGELRALADDPDFRELRESRFGKDVWGN
ncbi:MAG TPA: tetratricopeptide repeat protein [Planctomycetota bacterium]|nr:tetratricopeptide repeat protein [Planctomycetota bacterium]